MNRLRSTSATAALGFLALSFTTTLSFSQDANAVAQRLKDTLASQGAQLNWTGATGGSGQVVLDGVTYGAAGIDDAIKLGRLTMDGVTDANGGYKVATMTLDGGSFTEDGMSFQMSPAILTGVTIPAAGATGYIGEALTYESGKVDRIEIKLGEKQVALIENSHFEMTPPAEGTLTFSGAADKVSADLTAIPDPKTQAIVQALGYQNITGNVQIAGTWNTKDGHMEISKYDFAVDNAGKFGMTFDIGGYTPDLIKEMQNISKQAAANPAGDADKLAMLGLFQKLVFNAASMRFEDASITNKALDFIAKQQGADPAQLKEQTKTIIPFLLASSPIKDEALKKSIADAVATYMDDPKSLTIRAKPATPQPFLALAAQGKTDPAALTTTLGVTVTAND